MTSKDYSQLLKGLRTEFEQSKSVRNLAFHSDIIRRKEATSTQVMLEGLQDFFKMRREWGQFLKWCLAIILLFNIFLVFFVGIDILKYKDEWFLRLVLTTNLADIIGLAYVVVNFLFSDKALRQTSSQSPASKNDQK